MLIIVQSHPNCILVRSDRLKYYSDNTESSCPHYIIVLSMIFGPYQNLYSTSYPRCSDFAESSLPYCSVKCRILLCYYSAPDETSLECPETQHLMLEISVSEIIKYTTWTKTLDIWYWVDTHLALHKCPKYLNKGCWIRLNLKPRISYNEEWWWSFINELTEPTFREEVLNQRAKISLISDEIKIIGKRN